MGYACRIRTTKVVASSSLVLLAQSDRFELTCAREKKWRDPLFPRQSSSQLQSAAFCCFIFSFFHGFQKPYILYGFWQQARVGGFRKHQDAKEMEVGDRQICVCMCHLYLCGSDQQQTVKLMYPGLPPEETKQYLHGDFVLSPVSLLLLFYPAIN